MMAKMKAMLNRKSQEYNTSSSSHKEKTEIDPLMDPFSLNLDFPEESNITTWR